MSVRKSEKEMGRHAVTQSFFKHSQHDPNPLSAQDICASFGAALHYYFHLLLTKSLGLSTVMIILIISSF